MRGNLISRLRFSERTLDLASVKLTACHYAPTLWIRHYGPTAALAEPITTITIEVGKGASPRWLSPYLDRINSQTTCTFSL
jgi:hypothetical protein